MLQVVTFQKSFLCIPAPLSLAGWVAAGYLFSVPRKPRNKTQSFQRMRSTVRGGSFQFRSLSILVAADVASMTMMLLATAALLHETLNPKPYKP